VLPGSKATISDLEFLRDQGWDVDLVAHVRRGGLVLGLCGGFQMLGRWLRDPRGVEGQPGDAPGLNLLAVETTLTGDKTLQRAEGVDLRLEQPVSGYEMHVGETSGGGLGRPMLRLGNRVEGAVSEDGLVMGCYLHGLFASDTYRHAFLDAIRKRETEGVSYEAEIEATLDALAAHLEQHLDLDALLAVARGRE
jgi:adenosylcobyric acid synthase